VRITLSPGAAYVIWREIYNLARNLQFGVALYRGHLGEDCREGLDAVECQADLGQANQPCV